MLSGRPAAAGRAGARARARTPQVLLLDEPLSNLDARLREEMRFELRDMQARLGITSIFVTHDQAEAMTLSDRIVVMNAGRIEQEGRPEDVYQRPTHALRHGLPRPCQSPAGPHRPGWRGLGGRWSNGNGCGMPVDDSAAETGAEGEDVLLAFRPEARAGAGRRADGAWVGVVRSSVYVGGHVEYVVDLGRITVRATGPEDPRLPHEPRARLSVSPRAVRLWPAEERSPKESRE